MKKNILLARSLLLISLILTVSMALVPAGTPLLSSQTSTTTKMWVDPLRYDGTVTVGEEFNVSVMITTPDVGLWSWQAGITFNTTVLNCTARGAGTFFAGKITGPFRAGQILNDQGYVKFSGQSLSIPESEGATGTGDLMWFTFEVIASGISDLHLVDVKVNTREGTTVFPFDCLVVDIYTVIADGSDFLVEIVHNSTGTGIYEAPTRPTGPLNHEFSITDKLTFDIIAVANGTAIFCNITIPKGLLDEDPWTVNLDGANITTQTTITENATHTFFSFIGTASQPSPLLSPKIEVQIIPEFPIAIMIPLLMIATLAAAILGKRIRTTERKGHFNT